MIARPLANSRSAVNGYAFNFSKRAISDGWSPWLDMLGAWSFDDEGLDVTSIVSVEGIGVNRRCNVDIVGGDRLSCGERSWTFSRGLIIGGVTYVGEELSSANPCTNVWERFVSYKLQVLLFSINRWLLSIQFITMSCH